MLVLKWLFFAIVGAAIGVIAGGQLGAFRGSPPSDLGLRDGRLKAPSRNPNSVSSQADLHADHPQREYARIAPIALAGDGAATIAKLKAIVEAMPGGEVVQAGPDYLYARFSTRLMKYVDDAEFWFDPAANAIQVRSASRLGRKDFGVNRARIEAIRARLK